MTPRDALERVEQLVDDLRRGTGRIIPTEDIAALCRELREARKDVAAAVENERRAVFTALFANGSVDGRIHGGFDVVEFRAEYYRQARNREGV